MQTIRHCWDQISAYSSHFGGYQLDGITFRIYVADWLDGDSSITTKFPPADRKGYRDRGMVGHCNLVFYGTKTISLEIIPCLMLDSNGDEVWGKASLKFWNKLQGFGENKYSFEGKCLVDQTWISLDIQAESFSLEILDLNESGNQNISILGIMD
jgi:hypothetical protein